MLGDYPWQKTARCGMTFSMNLNDPERFEFREYPDGYRYYLAGLPLEEGTVLELRKLNESFYGQFIWPDRSVPYVYLRDQETGRTHNLSYFSRLQRVRQ